MEMNSLTHGSGNGLLHSKYQQGKQNNYYLKQLGQRVECKSGKILARPGEILSHCFFIRTGRVAAFATTSAGNERLLYSFEADNLILAQYVISGKPCSLHYRAIIPTVAQMISLNELTQAMCSCHAVTLDVIDAISEYSEIAIQRLINDLEPKAGARIAGQFIDLADVFGVVCGDKIMIAEKITQDMIASLVGLHRVTVAKEMKKLKDCGILSQKEGNYFISDLKALIAYRNNCIEQ